MIDMNSFGLPEMSKHREAELNALIISAQQNSFEKNSINLINYIDLINQMGLVNMKSPLETGINELILFILLKQAKFILHDY